MISVGDAYYSFIGNYIIDYTEFGDDDAGAAEKEVTGAQICAIVYEKKGRFIKEAAS